ncbi:hypothetical protein Baya_5770 [Bagarius yarrelli]|uniref:Uncharacterized protein n=1 Tax=Bagarius yarrelli TaxID=175774 RepID=A0A556TYI0_BAGYA|nr:hypothetical protein Baya_5770 [Bagarius yarrelli]
MLLFTPAPSPTSGEPGRNSPGQKKTSPHRKELETYDEKKFVVGLQRCRQSESVSTLNLSLILHTALPPSGTLGEEGERRGGGKNGDTENKEKKKRWEKRKIGGGGNEAGKRRRISRRDCDVSEDTSGVLCVFVPEKKVPVEPKPRATG